MPSLGWNESRPESSDLQELSSELMILLTGVEKAAFKLVERDNGELKALILLRFTRQWLSSFCPRFSRFTLVAIARMIY